MRVEVVPELLPGNPGHVALGRWDYGIPASTGGLAEPTGPQRWANDQVGIELLDEGLAVTTRGRAEQTLTLACVVGAPDARVTRPPRLAQWRAETRRAWARRLDGVLTRTPTLTSDIPGLESYYARSLASGLVCLWDRPDFVTRPFVATSGMDGGAVCCYPWDTGGYASHALTLMLGERVHDIVAVQLSDRLMEKHSRFAPD